MHEAILDANILLRYLTDEPRDLADRAIAILEEAEERRVTLVIAPLVLAEVIYVLQSVYHWPRADIANGLLGLVSASVFTILDEASILQALHWYRDRNGLDFADAYVAALAIERGHATVISFDRDVGRLPGITAIQQPGTFDEV